ncbi:hypothetical protein MJL33_34515, partial [Salmonella enterica subsp. enterica serovar Kentucky]|nr:hypothetical protein [Salmonella enterica subsp. enterica serovar Kentucky]
LRLLISGRARSILKVVSPKAITSSPITRRTILALFSASQAQNKNWRRKLTATLEQMFADEGVNKLIKDLDKRRKAAAKKK